MSSRSRKSKRYLVFISHASRDRWIAKQMSRLIEHQRIQTFLDEKDIESGESIPESIRKNIRECSEFLVVLSSASIDRKWVLLEMGAAWGLEKYIVVILDKMSPQQMPEISTPYKAVDLNNFEQYLRELSRRAKEAR